MFCLFNSLSFIFFGLIGIGFGCFIDEKIDSFVVIYETEKVLYRFKN